MTSAPETRRLCSPCAKDTGINRCPKTGAVIRPGHICARCLSDGRLLVEYRICCEPESRFGHTDACRKARKVDTAPLLRRFAVVLFSTDARVLALTSAVLDTTDKRVVTVGKAWDLAADGHEPEATYRKEAEARAFDMQKFDRELQDFLKETARLTRESERKAALVAGQRSNAQLPPPLSQTEHQANVALVRHEEERKAHEHRLKQLDALEQLAHRQNEKRKAEKLAGICGAFSPMRDRVHVNGHRHSVFDNERCTRSKHEYGPHHFEVDGLLVSNWLGDQYNVLNVPSVPGQLPLKVIGYIGRP